MPNLNLDKRWLAAGAIVLVLAAGFFLPRYLGVPASPAADATVPPALVAHNGSASAQDAPSPSPAATSADLAVYVCGAVKKPGVYHFPQGARVLDALAGAGGAAAEADLDVINLAEPLTDAMKVCVPRKGQAMSDFAGPEISTAQSATGTARHHRGRSRGSASRGGGAHKLQPGQTLDVNTAGADQLVSLPGVGPSLAQRIIDYRQQYGPFQTADDLQNVPGIGPSKFDKLQPFVRL
jgi:competence protein ComEA